MIVRIDWFGPEAFLVQSAASARPALRGWLTAEGLATARAGDVEALRIEGRYPAARDIPPKTLPQELGRTAQAISFTKGCYLGQEVMARIQSMGSLRRILRRVESTDGTPLVAGSELSVAGKVIGKVRSAAGPLGLALVNLDQPVGVVCAAVSGGVVLGAPAALPFVKA
jgi:folate-binding protein YgfZ